jgi:hypothetical protein
VQSLTPREQQAVYGGQTQDQQLVAEAHLRSSWGRFKPAENDSAFYPVLRPAPVDF